MKLELGNIIRHKKHSEYYQIIRMPQRITNYADVLCMPIKVNWYTGDVLEQLGKPCLIPQSDLSINYFTVMKHNKRDKFDALEFDREWYDEEGKLIWDYAKEES